MLLVKPANEQIDSFKSPNILSVCWYVSVLF